MYVGDSEYDDDDFIIEGTKNALRAKDRLEKAEFLEVCIIYDHVCLCVYCPLFL